LRISSLDAGNLYKQLPYSDNSGVWRGIGIRGGLDDDRYQLSIIDPGIENWVNSSSGNIPERWGPQKNFGDFGLRAFIRLGSNNSYGKFFIVLTIIYKYIYYCNQKSLSLPPYF